MARIFLSYAREDHDAAQQFAGAMEEAGHEVWWDHHLRAGSRFTWEIDAELKAAEAVVVLWSQASVQSAWVQDEAAEGLEGSRLVPIALDGTRAPLGFRQYHTVDGSEWRGGSAGFRNLLAAIDAKTTGPGVAAPHSPAEVRPTRPTVCVMPFTNKSGNPEQDYFSEGITEDVITDLSKVSALSVLGRNAVLGADGQVANIKELARDFGVTHVIEGAVRKSDSRVRITAQLVESSAGHTLWAERFDREFTDIFEVQDEISQAIVGALRLTLLPTEQAALDDRGTTSVEAYDRYLRARALWSTGKVGDTRSLEEIVRLCRETTALDPRYASAWAVMSIATAELRFWQGRDLDALAPAQRAIALDPSLPEPHCVRARNFAETADEGDADAAVHIALELGPDSWEANREAAQLLFRRGRLRESISFLEKALTLKFTEHDSASMLIACFDAIGDAPGMRRAAVIAVDRAERLIISDPCNGSAFASAAYAFAALGEGERARKWIRKALAVDPGNLSMRYTAAGALASLFGDEETALDVLEPFIESVRFTPHVRLLELDPRWNRIRDGEAFQSALARARKIVAALTPGMLMS